MACLYQVTTCRSGSNEEYGEKEQLMGEAVALIDEKEEREENTALKKKEEGEKRAKAVEIRDDSMKRMGEKRKSGT